MMSAMPWLIAAAIIVIPVAREMVADSPFGVSGAMNDAGRR